jgi:hypothetical protein
MLELLRKALADWFSRYATREQILAVDTRRDVPPGWPARGGLMQSIMWMGNGVPKRAAETLRLYWQDYQANGKNAGHGHFVHAVAKLLGLSL